MSEEQTKKWYEAFTREQLIERCEYLQRSCERKEQDIASQYDEIVTLTTKIDKTIELIEDDYFEAGSGNNIDKVLEILKGDRNGNI